MVTAVLITGVSGGGNGRQSMKALRLAKTDYRIIGTDITPASLGLYYADKEYIVPKVIEENYLENILAICRKEKIKVIIPGSEPELYFFSKNRQIFADLGILLLINTEEVIEACKDKWKTFEVLTKLGFKVPKSYVPKDKKDFNRSLKYPVVIKPYVGGGGSKGVYIAQTDEELSFFIDYNAKQGVSSIIQEYVGFPEQEFTVGVLNSLDGELMGTFVLKRLVKSALSVKYSVKDYKKDQLYTISTGISQGEVGEFPKIKKYCEKLAKAIDSRGPLNIQCRQAEDGIYVFEINPRLSGTTSIRALCGFNEPDALIRKHLLGKKPILDRKDGLVLRDLENLYIKPERLKKAQNTKVKGKRKR